MQEEFGGELDLEILLARRVRGPEHKLVARSTRAHLVSFQLSQVRSVGCNQPDQQRVQQFRTGIKRCFEIFSGTLGQLIKSWAAIQNSLKEDGNE